MKKFIMLITIVVILVFTTVFFFVTHPFPVSPNPDYDATTYEEFVAKLAASKQEYLVLDSVYFQKSNGETLYRIILINRDSFESKGYICSINNYEGQDRERILYISAKTDDQSDLSEDAVQHIFYSQVEIRYEQQEDNLSVAFQYGGLYYSIRSYEKSTFDAITIAKDMIDSGTV